MKVSIIIPVCNMEQYISTCLDSIFQQTLSDIEIICVDDGSTDGTWEILQAYAAKHANMVLLSQNHQYSGIARNRGIEIATGEYVAFMDADDFYPDFKTIEKLYCTAKKQSASICGGSIHEFRDDGDVVPVQPNWTFVKEGWVEYQDYQSPYGFTAFIYSRQMLLENEIFFPGYRRFQDPVFKVQAFQCAGRFYVIPDMVYERRVIDKYPAHVEVVLGMTDVLEFSYMHGLYKLWEKMADGLEKWIDSLYCQIVLRNDTESKLLIQRIAGHTHGRLQQCLFCTEAGDLEMHKIQQRVSMIIREKNRLAQRIQGNDKIAIYGAGYVGGFMEKYLEEVFHRKADFYIVTSMEGNPSTKARLPVISLDEFMLHKDDCLILVATYDRLHAVIRGELEKYGYQDAVYPHYSECMAVRMLKS